MVDNDKEFARHREVRCPGLPMYFAHPYSPWEWGTNENTNGLICEYLSRGLDFRGVQNDDVLRIVERLNKRPGKCLGFRTPREAFLNLPVAFGLRIQNLKVDMPWPGQRANGWSGRMFRSRAG